ncbi:MAG: methyltransferase domain-containing protein [Chlamydiae bacterium]|nr:methyltransferase domain-containing protein [Chlamydiota bacterium]MBI3276392.1 methyltransferase domain-containing protein [Chlamydiota bacterium]
MKKSFEPEWMDHSTSKMDVEGSLKDLRWINRYLGGYKTILKNIEEQVRKRKIKELSILDIATGSGDIPIEMVLWARKQGITTSIKAIDKNPQMIEIAQGRSISYPEISYEVGNVFNLPYQDETFDFCTTSLFLHHLGSKDWLPFLREMLRLAKRAVLVNDLIRAWIPYYGFKFLARAFRFHPMTRHDGAVSVLRAFTIDEIEKLIREGDFKGCEIRRHFPYRFCLVLNKWGEGSLI